MFQLVSQLLTVTVIVSPLLYEEGLGVPISPSRYRRVGFAREQHLQLGVGARNNR